MSGKAMNVYVVEVYDEDYSYIAGVFADEAHATRFAEEMGGHVEDHEVEFGAVETQTTHTLRGAVAVRWIKWRGASPDELSGEIKEFVVQHENHDKETHRSDGQEPVATSVESELHIGPSQDRWSIRPEHPHVSISAKGTDEDAVRRAYEEETEKAKRALANDPSVLSHLRPNIEDWGTGKVLEMMTLGSPMIIEDGAELMRYRWADD